MDDLLKLLMTECMPYIRDLQNCAKGSFLLRGFKEEINGFKLFKHNIEYRKPLNTPLISHNQINSLFYPKFGWNIRNGIFCYGFNVLIDSPLDLGYGKQFLFFPRGNYKFVYNEDHFDIFNYVSKVSSKITDFEKLNFKSDCLEYAINSGLKEDGFSNEISVNADSYYLIDINLKKNIVEMIWPT